MLKVAHHGSAYQDPGLLAAARPRVALISAGAGNDYGHPAPAHPVGAAPRRRARRAHRHRRHPGRGGAAGTGSGSSGPAGSVTAMPAAPGPAPLTLVTGPEALLRDRAVATAVAAVRAVDPETEVNDLSAVGLEPGRLTGLASPSLFGGVTVIVVRDVGDAAEDVADELKGVLAAPLDDIVLVLVHPGGTKGKSLLDAARKAGAVVVECKAVKWESDKVSFVQGEFKAAGRRVAPDAAVALVDALGSDLRELASACAQLVADTSGTVDRELVERYHAGRVEVTGFKVADAAVEGRYEEALAAAPASAGDRRRPGPGQRGLRGRAAHPGQGGRSVAVGPARRRRAGPRVWRRSRSRRPAASSAAGPPTACPRRSSRWPTPTSRSRAAAPIRSTPWSARWWRSWRPAA